MFSRTYTVGVYYPSYYSYSSSSCPHLSVIKIQSTNRGRSPVPTLFLHQRTAPSQGAVISLYLASVCVCLCVCVDGWPVSKSVQCPVVGRLLILDPSIAIRREVLFTTHTEILRENSPQCHTVVVKFSRMETS